MANNHKKGGWKQMQSSLKWNLELKPNSSTYPKFEVIFEVLSMIFFGQATYSFEAQEVKSSTLQTVSKLELKWRSYSHLKTTTQS